MGEGGGEGPSRRASRVAGTNTPLLRLLPRVLGRRRLVLERSAHHRGTLSLVPATTPSVKIVHALDSPVVCEARTSPMTAMPVMIGVLCLMAIAYRYYSAFLAAKVAVLDDSRAT